MSSDSAKPRPLTLLVGPTASGKSGFAPELAERLGAEIASLDSMLVYRGMDLGTAKPDAAVRARVRHHLIDIVEPHEAYSVARYVDDARVVQEALALRGQTALFVGGTALYLKALTHGLFHGPDVDPRLRAELEARWESLGPGAIFEELERIDPLSALRLHRNDKKRVLRALEVHAQSGRSLSEWQREWRDGGERTAGCERRIIALEVSNEELDRRIPLRTRAMLEAGWVEEACRVRSGAGFGRSAGQALGYAEVLELADGKITRADCEARINLRTRQFARRQRTWFRQFPEIRWLCVKKPDALETALDHLRG